MKVGGQDMGNCGWDIAHWPVLSHGQRDCCCPLDRPPTAPACPSSPTLQEKKELPAEYVANQKAVDTALLAGLDADLKGYLSTRFTLRDGDRPHLMKF